MFGSLASLSKKSNDTESILLYTYRLRDVSPHDEHAQEKEEGPFDVFPVVLHDNIDEVIYGRCIYQLPTLSIVRGLMPTVFVTHQYLTVEHLVVS